MGGGGRADGGDQEEEEGLGAGVGMESSRGYDR